MGRRDQLVDAAEACFLRMGLDKVTVDDIAAEAGVSRATVYRHVRDRDELVLAVFAREADRLLARMHRAGARSIVDGVLLAVREVPAQPLLLEVLHAPPAGAWEVCHERALATMGAALDPDTVEAVLRMVLSLLLVPSHRSPADLRSFLERFLD
jgi:AcrR family transcriptional regulator